MKVYLASSWRNRRQPELVQWLRDLGHEVYDFRHPYSGNNGFTWAEIDLLWGEWTPEQFIAALEHPLAVAGFRCDATALEQAEAVILVMPCGRSSHLELGWAAGAGKRTAIFLDGRAEPELMYKLAHLVTASLPRLGAWLEQPDP